MSCLRLQLVTPPGTPETNIEGGPEAQQASSIARQIRQLQAIGVQVHMPDSAAAATTTEAHDSVRSHMCSAPAFSFFLSDAGFKHR